MTNKSGIYKITSPSGRVYIGQAQNIRLRWRSYEILTPSVRNQTLLYRSFLKYGVSNHLFDVIEFCDVENLNCSERFWQDEFNVLEEGLNLTLTECGGIRAKDSDSTRKKKSDKMLRGGNHKAKKVINLDTLEIYDCAQDVADLLNLSKTTLCQYLRGVRKNKTKFLYLDYYLKMKAL